MNNYNKQDIIKRYGYEPKDTGLTEVQVIILTHKIKHLTIHFKFHKKDNHSRQGLLRMSSKRKKLLKYLKKTSQERYLNILSLLNLKK
jgi:small subunit ribosomal protein S15